MKKIERLKKRRTNRSDVGQPISGRYWLPLLTGFSFLFYLYLFSQTPYVHDDWDWGLSVGIEQLVTANINSRYTGNLLIVLMTRSRIFRDLFMALVAAAIPLYLVKLSGLNGKLGAVVFLLMNTVILTQDPAIWKQTYGWTSGFANYVVSDLAVLVYFAIIERSFTSEKQEIRTAALILMAIFAFAAQMFIENLTIWLLAADILAFALAMKAKRAARETGALLAGAVLGTVAMFSSSIYGSIVESGQALGGGRKILIFTGDSLTEVAAVILEEGKENIVKLYERNVELCVLLLLLFSALLLINVLKRQSGAAPDLRLLNGASTGAIALNIALIGCLIGTSAEMPFFINLFQERAPGLLSLVMFSLVLVEFFLLWRLDQKRKYLYYAFIWASSLLVFLPLAVTNVGGGRLFSLPFTLQLLVAAKLCGCLCTSPLLSAGTTRRKALNAAFLVMLVITAIPAGRKARDYFEIGKIAKEQLKIIEAAKENGAGKITLPAYSYDLEMNYLWYPHPKGGLRESYFKAFYGIEDSVELEYVYQ